MTGAEPIKAPKGVRREDEDDERDVDRDHAEIEALNRIFEPMWSEREQMLDVWADCCAYVKPHRRRFGSEMDPSRGSLSHSRILDDTATRALNVAVSGALSGMASPAREWFDYSVPGFNIGRDDEVEMWLQDFRNATLGVYERTNIYQQLGILLEDEFLVGTGAFAVFEDAERVIRAQSFPVGGYSIMQDWAGQVIGFCREYMMTADQVAREYGIDKLSKDTQMALERGSKESRVIIRHLIVPRSDELTGPRPYIERYWESGITTQGGAGSRGNPTWALGRGGNGSGSVLKRGGYHEFPIIVGRWARDMTSLWATDWPTLSCLGNIKELQAQRKDYSNALAKTGNPPLNVDSSLLGYPVSLHSGAKNYVDGLANGNPGVTPTFQFNYRLGEMQQGMQQLRQDIRETYMVPVFQDIREREGVQPLQNEETRARIQERGEILSPIQEGHGDQVFDKLIDRTVSVMIRRSQPGWDEMPGAKPPLVPPPPEALRDSEAEIRPIYTGEVVRAQKLAALAPLERLVQFGASYAQTISPSVLDKFDDDDIIELVSDVLGTPKSALRTADEVAPIREERRQQEAAARAAEAMPKVASTARDLGQTPTGGGGTALDLLLSDGGSALRG
jgi:hypothetical protein